MNEVITLSITKGFPSVRRNLSSKGFPDILRCVAAVFNTATCPSFGGTKAFLVFTFFFLDLLFDGLDGIRAFNINGNRLARECFDEDLHGYYFTRFYIKSLWRIMNNLSLFSLSDDKINNSLVTPYSLIHFLTGFLAYFITTITLKMDVVSGGIIWFIVHGLYEIGDYHKSYTLQQNDYWGSSSSVNSVLDQFIAMLGFITAYLSGLRLTNAHNLAMLVVVSLLALSFAQNKLA